MLEPLRISSRQNRPISCLGPAHEAGIHRLELAVLSPQADKVR